MTTNRLTTTLAAALLVASLLVGGVGAASAQQAQPTTDTATADLAVGQPHYLESDVRERTENGTQVYIAKGERLTLTPKNFESANVTDYRVLTDGGQLTYDDALETYVFRPESGEGTYDLEWTVREYETVTHTTNNTTTTETRRVDRTYTASVRVDGGLGMSHISASENDRRQHYLELGREVNATTQELRDRSLPFARNDGTDYEIYQAQTDRYVNTGNPVGLLSGNLGAIVTMLVMSMGGWLLIVLVFGGFGNAIRQLKKKLHIHESIEHEEGEIADRQADMQLGEILRGLENVDWNDWFEDDAMADWMRNSGENPHDGLQTLTSGELCPNHWMRDRLFVMGEAGYQADVERTATDGGDTDDATGEITHATLATPDAEGDDLEPIADLEIAQLVDAIDWDDAVLWDQFRLPEADVDFDSLERKPPTMDLDTTISEANLQVERFPNKRVAGRCLRELVESIEEHEYTDVEGRPQTIREAWNNQLKALRKASDRHRLPVRGIAEAVEQALINHDPNEEARQVAQEVRAGAD